MDELVRLSALDEIRKLKARYFRCVDTKDWVGFGEVFTADAVLDMSASSAIVDGPVIEGRVAIVDWARNAVKPLVATVHRGYNDEIEVTEPGSATAIWAMQDTLWFPEDAELAGYDGFGHYHDSYILDDGQWRIARARLTRLHVDVTTR